LRKNSNLGFAEAEIQFVSNHVDTGIGYFWNMKFYDIQNVSLCVFEVRGTK
jgi:hypothetical protein